MLLLFPQRHAYNERGHSFRTPHHQLILSLFYVTIPLRLCVCEPSGYGSARHFPFWLASHACPDYLRHRYFLIDWLFVWNRGYLILVFDCVCARVCLSVLVCTLFVNLHWDTPKWPHWFQSCPTGLQFDGNKRSTAHCCCDQFTRFAFFPNRSKTRETQWY